MNGRGDGAGARHAPVSDVRIDVGGAGDQRKKVVVIGAGFAGLSAACYLAKEGFAVTVIDRLPEVHTARFHTPLCSADTTMSMSHPRRRRVAFRRACHRSGPCIPNPVSRGSGRKGTLNVLEEEKRSVGRERREAVVAVDMRASR